MCHINTKSLVRNLFTLYCIVLSGRLTIVTLLQWYNFRTARSVTLWCIRQGGKSSNCIGSPHWGSPRPVPGLVDWLLQMLHPSAFWGTIFSTLVSADVQVFSMVFTFGACSSSILGAHHTGDRGGARTLDPCVSSFVIVLIPRFIFASRLSDRGCWGKPPKDNYFLY